MYSSNFAEVVMAFSFRGLPLWESDRLQSHGNKLGRLRSIARSASLN